MNLQTFWMVNAFTNERFKGNPAGVFVLEKFPKEDLMQSIAAELNWSQTAFCCVTNENNGSLVAHIRWFSPRDETKICGHATLATSHILFEKIYPHSQSIEYDSLSGKLYAHKDKDQKISLNFPLKPLKKCECPLELYKALVDVHGNIVEIEEVLRDDAIYVVVLKNTFDLLNLAPQLNVIEHLETRAVCVTAKGENKFDYYSRYFAPKVGIPEDPVCGSSHTRLAPYWSNKLGGKKKLHTFQASRRTGTFDVEVCDDRVYLIADAITVFEGKIEI